MAVKIHPLHRWDLSAAEAITLQKELADRVDIRTPLTHCDLIAGAVLYEPPLPGMASGFGSSKAMLTALEEERYEEALIAFLTDLVRLPAADIAAYRASPIWDSRVRLIWTMQRESSALQALDQDVARYSIITRPVRLLVGSRTAPHQAEAVKALATVIPNAAITVLDNQGHGALLQAPGLVASAISDFILQPD